nr:T9SS type A sorting domain-containing protein [Candidatus Neomarinimicrobiota bacterium]
FGAQDDPDKAKENIDQIAVVPNPYVAAASWEPSRMLASGRGERRINFVHLPSSCSIRIYTMSGDHVQTLRHESSADDGSEPWNLTTKDGLDLAAGVYFYHVDAGNAGEFTGKFAVIK